MKQRSYPTDLTDGEWSIIEPLLPPPKTRGSKRTTDLRKVVNAILYLLHEGCQWRALPHDFPPYQTVRTYLTDGNVKKYGKRLIQLSGNSSGWHKGENQLQVLLQLIVSRSRLAKKGGGVWLRWRQKRQGKKTTYSS